VACKTVRGAAVGTKQHVACQNSRGAGVGTQKEKQHVACKTVARPLSAEAARGLLNSRGAAVGRRSTWAVRQSRARGAVVPADPKKKKKKSRLLT
jgi:hypothetical protein